MLLNNSCELFVHNIYFDIATLCIVCVCVCRRMLLETKGCYLIQWRSDLSAIPELNTQIILCGFAGLLLPLFFISTIFKVKRDYYRLDYNNGKPKQNKKWWATKTKQKMMEIHEYRKLYMWHLLPFYIVFQQIKNIWLYFISPLLVISKRLEILRTMALNWHHWQAENVQPNLKMV